MTTRPVTCSSEGARGALIKIAAGANLTLFEANEAASVIREATGHEANIIFGTVVDESLVDEMRVTVIATGFYLNNDAENGAEEEEARKAEGQRRFTGRAQLAAQEEARASEAGESQDEAEGTSTWREDLDYPAILRKKMA